MPGDILISLRPEHAENILTGLKTVEVRRRPVRICAGTRLWIYTTRPKGCVEAFAIVDAVYEGSRDELWTQFGTKVAITRDQFNNYMHGSDVGCAIVLGSVARLGRAIHLEEIRRHFGSFHPPQFFKKLFPDSAELAYLLKGIRPTNTGMRFIPSFSTDI